MRDRILWLAAIVLVSFLAIWPFVSREALPAATDAELHIYRLAELARLVSAGELYPRIAPNFYYGYGYPIFNYYAPFSYYLGLLPMAVGFSAVQAVKLVFIFGLLLGAFGMAGFVRRYWGPHAGLIAAAAYIYAPFVHFVEAHARGDLPESLSLGLLPLAFWAMAVLSEKRTTRHWLVAVGIVAVIVLTHNLMALVFAALLAAWLCWAWLVKSDSRGDVYWRGAALLAGILLASFFWLPVFLERDAVNLGSLIGQGDHFDFRNHFLSLRTLFSAPTLLDWGATEPEFAFNLGLPQIALGLMGTVSLAYRWRRENRQLFLRWLFYLVGLLLILLLMLPISTPVWSLVPLLPFLQFPWRLLGVATFCLAVLGAVGAHEALAQISKRWGNSAATWSGGIALGVILATSMPLAQPPPWNPDFGPTSAGRVLDIELSGRWLGTTSTADFVPVTVEVMPKPQPSVMAGLSSGGPVDRIN
jgi:uncharacterized membrane protein